MISIPQHIILLTDSVIEMWNEHINEMGDDTPVKISTNDGDHSALDALHINITTVKDALVVFSDDEWIDSDFNDNPNMPNWREITDDDWRVITGRVIDYFLAEHPNRWDNGTEWETEDDE
jgi:hypothetical protein